jgi:alpha/beta superfamily hydrolase
MVHGSSFLRIAVLAPSLLAARGAWAAGAAAVLSPAPAAAAARSLELRQTVSLTASDGTSLRADWWHGGTDTAGIVVVLPGYAQHKGTGTMRYIAGELSPTSDVLVLDFRGTGDSAGSFTFGAQEPEDAQAALQWATERYRDVTLLGFSLGSYTALRTSVEGPLRPDRALLVSLPVRLEGIISSGGVFSFCFKGVWQQAHDPLVVPEDADQFFRWGPLFLPKPKAPDLAAQAAIPLHLLSGAKDLLVYSDQSRRSFDAIPGAASWTLWPDGRHAEHMALKHPQAFADWVQHCRQWTGTGKAEDPFGVPE